MFKIKIKLHGKTVNIYIVYEISKNYNITSYPTLENCLFGAVSLTKNNDIDVYKYLDMELDWTESELFHLLMDLIEIV